MKERIRNWLENHRDEMVRDIFDLVRIDSEKMPAKEGMPYGEGPAHALALALSKAEGYGFATQNHENYVGSIDMSDSVRGLDILAHLDVVPATPGFTVTAPFEPVEKDGKLYGRGTADDKGPAMAALYAMRALKELGVPLRKNVRLILGCDEECGSSDIEYYYKKEAAAPCTFSPDACFPVVNVEKGHLVAAFVCKTEPKSGAKPCITEAQSGMKFNVVPDTAMMRVVNVDRSILATAAKDLARELPVKITIETFSDSLRVTVKGKSAHASTPELGVNALTAMLKLLQDAKDAFSGTEDAATKALLALSEVLVHADHAGQALGIDRDHEVTGPTTVSPDILELTDGNLRLTIDSRMALGSTRENTAGTLERVAETCGCTFDVERYSETHYVPADSEFVKTLLKCYEDVFGREGSKPIAMGGGTYVHEVENGVAFGCVEDEEEVNMHGDDEHIAVEDLLNGSVTFALAIYAICGGE